MLARDDEPSSSPPISRIDNFLLWIPNRLMGFWELHANIRLYPKSVCTQMLSAGSTWGVFLGGCAAQKHTPQKNSWQVLRSHLRAKSLLSWHQKLYLVALRPNWIDNKIWRISDWAPDAEVTRWRFLPVKGLLMSLSRIGLENQID